MALLSCIKIGIIKFQSLMTFWLYALQIKERVNSKKTSETE